MKHILITTALIFGMQSLYAGIEAEKPPTDNSASAAKLSSPIYKSDIFTLTDIPEADHIPAVDGEPSDACWQKISAEHVTLTGEDNSSMTLSLKICTGKERVFIMIQYPLKKLCTAHRLWHWNKKSSIYMPGQECEESVQLLFPGTDKEKYKRDLWVWRAGRTNPANYADDMFISAGIYKMDDGIPGWFSKYFSNFAGDNLPRFYRKTPSGSAADIKAKGKLSDGILTVEFSRKLTTGHNDDLSISPDMLRLQIIRETGHN